MTTPSWPRVKSVFEEAVVRAPHLRAGFLEEACAGDAELRREVESLLAAHLQAGAFLSGGAVTEGAGSPTVENARAPAERIGPYRVLGVIGRGGMGTVYRAVRDDDSFQKTVALKLVRGGGAPSFVDRRFRQERQILARLQHPNIAAILDGGTTDEGHPYLVMEHVDGRPITAYCAERGLGTRQRLALFGPVCSAVQYAHQNLVVHRDIKPDNILVTADGTPKLLDFGIAKLLAAGVDPETAPTATLLPMMTPEYASPEQVRGEPVTTASDVYSLGVLLYELLAGHRPYALRSGSLEDIVRAVCETEPPPPSLAVKTLSRGDTAAAPGTPATASELKGDLDTIVLRALSKEPARRYPSVRELGEDLRRHLDGLPVRARPDTLRYRVQKFVGRHRALVAAAALGLAALAGGITSTLREARIAQRSRRDAERRFDDVRKLATFVMFDMHDAIAKLPGSTRARQQLVARALEYLDALAAEQGGDPALRAEIARGYERLSEVQGHPMVANLGDGAGAVASLRKALSLREELAAHAAAWSPEALALAQTRVELARLLISEAHDLSDAGVSEARPILDSTRAALDGVPPEHAGDARVLYVSVDYFDARAALEREAGDFKALAETRRQEVEAARRLLAKDPSDVERRRQLAVCVRYQGAALHLLGERRQARERYDEALALDQQVVAAEPSNVQRKLDLSYDHASIGSLLRDQGDLDGALRAYDQAVQLRQAARAADPDDALAFRILARGYVSIAGVMELKGDVDGAVRARQQELELQLAWEKGHPSAYGGRRWQALYERAVGDHCVAVASRAATPAAGKAALWRRARGGYTRALGLWLDAEKVQPLQGGDASEPAALRQAIDRCDRALAAAGNGKG